MLENAFTDRWELKAKRVECRGHVIDLSLCKTTFKEIFIV